MPLYEYLCTACGQRFERIRKFSDPPLTECPTCGGLVEKQFSSPAIQFKGSGWYINDYAKAGKAETKSDGNSDTKSDSKAEKAGSEGGKADAKTESSSSESKSEKASSTETAVKAPAAAPATDKK